jgi:heterotetrameric sarcosine oxidase delta subunit
LQNERLRLARRARFGETGNTVSPAAIPRRPRISFLLTCPNCGPRDVNEFAYAGEVTVRPTSAPGLRELNDYVYFRRNVAGVQREWWHHRFGCELWFLAERDTRTNEVLRVELPSAPEAKAAPEPVLPDTPAA